MTGGDTVHAAAAWRTEETEPFSICLLRLITRTIRCEAVVGTALTSIGLVADIAGGVSCGSLDCQHRSIVEESSISFGTN